MIHPGDESGRDSFLMVKWAHRRVPRSLAGVRLNIITVRGTARRLRRG